MAFLAKWLKTIHAVGLGVILGKRVRERIAKVKRPVSFIVARLQ